MLILIILFLIVGVNINNFQGKQHSSLDESCLIGIFDIQHHVFLPFVAVFLKDLLFDFEILFIVGFGGIEVSTSVETGRFDVFFVDGVGAFFGDGFVGFGDDRFNSYHFPNKKLNIEYLKIITHISSPKIMKKIYIIIAKPALSSISVSPKLVYT